MSYSLDNPKVIDKYFYLWSFVLPVSSVLVVPSIQGSTPGYILALASLFLALFVYKFNVNQLGMLDDIFKILFVFVALNIISQLTNVFFDIPSMQHLRLVELDNPLNTFMRSSMTTQTIYIIPGIITFAFVKRFYSYNWDKSVAISILVFALYGLYEFIYYLIFRDFGDFLSNRNFGSHETLKLGNQLMTLGPITFQRINGLTPEPSMFAFTLLPFWIYLKHVGYKKISALLLFTLILSTSTSAILGVGIYYLLQLLKINKLKLFFTFTTLIMTLIIFWNAIYLFIDKTILQKVSMSNESGMDRTRYFKDNIEYFLNLDPVNQLFGVGFGYIRSTDFASTLLVNNGIFGLLLVTLCFLYPVIKLQKSERNTGIKLALIIVYITMLVSVPEFSYLSIWLFLGIAYSEVRRQRLTTQVDQLA